MQQSVRISLFALLLAGCSLGSSVDVAPRATTGSVARSVPAQPSTTPSVPMPWLPTPEFDTVVASPRPRGQIDPVVPLPGHSAAIKVSDLPPSSTFGIWLVPTDIVYRFGYPAPGDRGAGGVKLGEASSDAAGRLSFAFEMKKDYPQNNGTAQGSLGIWLVYPQPKVIAPLVITWSAGNPTVFKGRLFDEKGLPIASGAKVKIKVTGYSSNQPMGDVTYFEAEANVIDGAYRFDEVPAPARTEITAVLPGGVTRTRSTGEGEMQTKWGPFSNSINCCNYGQPLTYNFGGPATAEDPWAPAYFVSERLRDPSFTHTTLSGKVYDRLGNPVPDSLGAFVAASGVEPFGNQPFYVKQPVIQGAYSIRVPIGIVNLDLRVGDGVHPVLNEYIAPRILLPDGPSTPPKVFNFGGSATPDEPDAPKFSYPSPQPLSSGPPTPQP